MKLRCRERWLDLDHTVVMGVLNVTPDSFSDGGRWLDENAAVAHAAEMIQQGAGALDVGGESTRPGAAPVPEDEELHRVLPVVERLAEQFDVPISIDTRKLSVARRCVESGASIINDTLGEAAVRGMDEVASDTGAAIIVMHSRGSPETMTTLTEYADVVAEVAGFLRARAGDLERAGVAHESIVLDPGFGFAKTPIQNLEILKALDTILEIGYPVLVGTSRKSFIGKILDLPTEQRLEATGATVAWGVMKGAHIVRVHDVEPIVRVVRMIEAIHNPSAFSALG